MGERTAEPGERLRDSTLMYLPDWQENLTFRFDVHEKAKRDEYFRSMQMLYCKSSILYFTNVFVWCFDPRPTSGARQTPFVSWEFQDEALLWMVWCIKNGRTSLIEKSRDMGMSWMAAICGAWLALFYRETEAFYMSLTENDVDNRKPTSLFGKIRYILKNLPDWMRGGWEEGPNSMDKSMAILIPDMGSTLSGILSKGTAGVGGRATCLFGDEFALVEDSETVLTAVSELTRVKFFMSTPRGTGNAFHRMATEPATTKITLHWRMHPLKNEGWAELRKGDADMSEERWAQEHEIQYELSMSGRVFPQFTFIKTPDVPWSHVQEGPLVRHEAAYDVYSTSDLGVADPCSTLWAQLKPASPEMQAYTKVSLVFFEEYESRNMTAADLRWLLNSKGFKYREYILDKRTSGIRDSDAKTWEINLADPDLKPRYSKAFRQLIHPGKPIRASGYRPVSLGDQGSIALFRQCLNIPGLIVFNKHGCKRAIQSLQNWAFPIDEDTRLPRPDAEPNHDQWSHYSKAALYLVAWLFGRPKSDQLSDESWQFPAFKLRVR